jgi:hypothetical protein
MNKKLQPCGTRAAYRRHKKNNETPCKVCLAANAKDSLSRYHKNPEKRKKSSLSWYYKNTDRVQKNVKIWAKENKEKKSMLDSRSFHRRRARKLNNGFEKYSELDIISLYGSICHICKIDIDLSLPRKTSIPGWEMGLHIDHLVPISKGGPDTLENVRPAHGICNLKKHAKTLSK